MIQLITIWFTIISRYCPSPPLGMTDPRGGFDAWVIKLSTTGATEWQRSYGGVGNDFAQGLSLTNDGGYILSGVTSSNDTYVSGNHGGSDAWVLKLDSSGNIQWQKCYGGSVNEYAEHVEQTSDGGYIVAGETSSNDKDVSGLHNAVGGTDVWILKLDNAGALQWQKTVGGTRGEFSVDIKQAPGGGYVFLGRTESNDMDAGGNHGGADDWVVKLDGSNTTLISLFIIAAEPAEYRTRIRRCWRARAVGRSPKDLLERVFLFHLQGI